MRCVTLLALLLAACDAQPPVRVDGLPLAQHRALLAATGDPASPIPLEIQVPAPGALVPWHFPSLRVSWRDGRMGGLARIRVRVPGGAPLIERVTAAHAVELSGADWASVRTTAGEGGAFEVEVLTGAFALTGRPLRPPAVRVAQVRFTAAAEHPSGALVYGRKVRPTDIGPGPVHPDHRSVILVQVPFDGHAASILLDRSPGVDAARLARREDVSRPDAPAPPRAEFSLDFSDRRPAKGMAAHSVDRERGVRNCLSCHTVSGDGRYLAFASQEEILVPAGWDSSQGVLHVLRASDRAEVRTLPSAVFPRFHPTVAGRLLYAQTGSSFSVKQRVSIYLSDLHVVDVEGGAPPRPIPGASDPDRCELFGDWSPDGAQLAFSRSERRQPCEGSRGRLELWVVPAGAMSASAARPLPVGAAAGARSNAQPRFSPDGRWLVFHSCDRGFFSRGSADLWIVAATGGEARRLEVSTAAMESWHAFGPGGWLAFVTNRERVDQPRIWLTRIGPDGHATPALPVPGASGPDVHVHTFDWSARAFVAPDAPR